MYSENLSRKRFPELDMIRLFSLNLIVAIHFFLNAGFYETLPVGWWYLPALLIRTFLSVSVPMFMMLTGYLLCGRSIRPGWWKNLGKTLLVYLISCIPCYFVRRTIETDYAPTIAGAFWSVLSFELNPYAWYIDLYIGLFLLSPFLNRMHQGLNQKQHRTLLAVLLLLIAVPTLMNRFLWFNSDFWRHPAAFVKFNQTVPNYWNDLPFALMYYEMGAYVRSYPPKRSAHSLLQMLLGFLAVFTAYNFWRQDGHAFQIEPWINYNGFEAALLTPMTFCFLIKAFAFRSWKKKTIRLLAVLSDLCLGAYLLSYCTDRLMYQYGKHSLSLSSFEEWLPWYPVFVPAGVALSLLCSLLITYPAKWSLRWLAERKAYRTGNIRNRTDERPGE